MARETGFGPLLFPKRGKTIVSGTDCAAIRGIKLRMDLSLSKLIRVSYADEGFVYEIKEYTVEEIVAAVKASRGVAGGLIEEIYLPAGFELQ